MFSNIPFDIYRSTKTFTNLPCAHRQWRHEGHCSKIHGYSRSFHFTFGAKSLTECGFVVDFSDLKDIRKWLVSMFDHTLLLNQDDPLLRDKNFMALDGDAFTLIILPNVGMEGTAKYVFEHVNTLILNKTDERAWVVSVEVRENDKNSAIFTRAQEC